MGGWGGWCKPILVLSFSLSHAGQFGLSQDEQKSYFRTDFADMEKGADARTLSAEIFDNCGNFWILEDYLLLLWKETV